MERFLVEKHDLYIVFAFLLEFIFDKVTTRFFDNANDIPMMPIWYLVLMEEVKQILCDKTNIIK